MISILELVSADNALLEGKLAVEIKYILQNKLHVHLEKERENISEESVFYSCYSTRIIVNQFTKPTKLHKTSF
jgi:hypothetical protein